jgi:hypothetical protein
MDFSCTLPMAASKSNAVEIISTPTKLKTGDTCESAENETQTLRNPVKQKRKAFT